MLSQTLKSYQTIELYGTDMVTNIFWPRGQMGYRTHPKLCNMFLTGEVNETTQFDSLTQMHVVTDP